MKRRSDRLCACGCGEFTTIRKTGHVNDYLVGHHFRKSGQEYIEDPETGCWVWQRATDTRGYGHLHVCGVRCMAHRWYFVTHGGTIPKGYEIDHLCRNTSCVNPAHLEAVTHAENVRRYVASKTHCANGHEWAEENIYVRPSDGSRCCLICLRTRNREAWRQKNWGVAA